MILLSRLIKSHWTEPNKTEKKVISIKILERPNQPEKTETAPVNTDIQVEAILKNAQLEAEAIINEAKLEAEYMQRQMNEQKQAFELEKETIAEQAREAGFSNGLEEGHKKGYTEYAELIQSAKEVVESAKKDFRRHVDSSEKTILNIGLKVAQKILGKSLQDNNEEFLSIVKLALKEARENQEVQLHVHPVHYEFLLSNKDELITLFPKEIDFYIFPDDDLSESSCIIESVNGKIDASIDSQLEEIKQKLIEMLEGE
ncbi:flagellar assembly protein FliH [Bacillus sp. FJAT-29790]|uniref:flagellar assembly protein FliH n=1 Tax=Bacillus sp. FJAT-29790 TaxID=1895002 RepID=UPI001C24EAF1|nr:flagellar assembly protein FliH [Bacillus sp. FJAT-29790]MBU8877830.1 flagellar assembly protein FliH [Bacillus sp. FJAT-29790]